MNKLRAWRLKIANKVATKGGRQVCEKHKSVNQVPLAKNALLTDKKIISHQLSAEDLT